MLSPHLKTTIYVCHLGYVFFFSPPKVYYLDFIHLAGFRAVQLPGQNSGYYCKEATRKILHISDMLSSLCMCCRAHNHVIFTQDFPKVNMASYPLLNSDELC